MCDPCFPLTKVRKDYTINNRNSSQAPRQSRMDSHQQPEGMPDPPDALTGVTSAKLLFVVF